MVLPCCCTYSQMMQYKQCNLLMRAPPRPSFRVGPFLRQRTPFLFPLIPSASRVIGGGLTEAEDLKTRKTSDFTFYTPTMAADLLFAVRNAFWVGNFEDAIGEAKAMTAAPSHIQIERDFYLMRAEIECGATATKTVDQSLPTALQAVQLLAAHRSGSISVEEVKETLDAWIGDENTGDNPLLQIIAATLYNRLGDWNKALTVLRSQATLEQ